ncbi:hypothetical protein C1646_756029 [Rhizophagus diaphanus]|nr:hypothetical protein C1646_756029 [Rhizophagus diaphanus] [Rhizophagus sp. MUCL 43196]
MNRGEISSGKGKRSVINENEELIASSDEEKITPKNNKKVLKAWVMVDIPFNVIETPFVLDLFKDLNPAYSPPSQTTLSDCLITEETV